jgi:hypothetical protein
MDAHQVPNDNAHDRFESAEDGRRRLELEAAMIAKADAEIEAGLYVDADEIDAWIDSIGTDHEAPPPPTMRRRLSGAVSGGAGEMHRMRAIGARLFQPS